MPVSSYSPNSYNNISRAESRNPLPLTTDATIGWTRDTVKNTTRTAVALGRDIGTMATAVHRQLNGIHNQYQINQANKELKKGASECNVRLFLHGLAHGAAINRVGKTIATAAHIVAALPPMRDRENMTHVALNAVDRGPNRANLGALDKYGRTPLDIAIRAGNDTFIREAVALMRQDPHRDIGLSAAVAERLPFDSARSNPPLGAALRDLLAAHRNRDIAAPTVPIRPVRQPVREQVPEQFRDSPLVYVNADVPYRANRATTMDDQYGQVNEAPTRPQSRHSVNQFADLFAEYSSENAANRGRPETPRRDSSGHRDQQFDIAPEPRSERRPRSPQEQQTPYVFVEPVREQPTARPLPATGHVRDIRAHFEQIAALNAGFGFDGSQRRPT
jgi:hypothetical protein